MAGAVVVIDVLRAFSTAAYALAGGARHVYVVGRVDEALAFKTANPGTLAMGEEHGRRPPGFDFANSPAELSRANVAGRVIVQRTSAGTQGVIAARAATRLWCAALVTASATRRYVSKPSATSQRVRPWPRASGIRIRKSPDSRGMRASYVCRPVVPAP